MEKITMFNCAKKILKTVCILTLSAATTHVLAAQYDSSDPLSGFNRSMYTFNDGLDHLILKPVAKAYNAVTPPPIADGVNNFYNNLDTIPTFVNDVLQTNFYQAATDAWRFAINSTVGLLGFIDVASKMGLPANSEDMGLTFAQWGWKKSTYLVLPFFGPSTIRDATGKPINYYFTVYPYIKNIRLRNALYGMGIVNTRAQLLQMQDVIQQAALDPYVFQRNAYLQRRNYLINRNKELGDPYLSSDNSSQGKTKKTVRESFKDAPPKEVATY